MGVTIDQIQVEIQSSSNNAAQGITDLSAALKELKKNGAIGTATKNLQKLSDSLRGFSSAYQASNSLRSLANSMEKLKSVGSVASITNSLAKLPAALKAIGSINIARIAPQIQEIASAVSPLSSIKAGGLSSMVNAMSKLGKVTEALDDDTIAAFAEKIELLNEKLGPLSQKMTSIKAGFSAINTGARKAASGVQELDHGIDTTSLNAASFIDVLTNLATAFQTAVQWFSAFVGEAIEWDGIAARFGRGFGAQAQETYEWIQRLNEEMGINIQQFMQYSSIYATMLTGFGVANKDATKMALGYTELTYDIWAGYNDVYNDFAEAADAVKSAIAGEVEPIRRAGFTIVESTLEQTAANHGLEISLANATEAQKSYLRYLTLVDQAHAQNLVGTYAKELNTAEGLMRTYAQQTKSLSQAFGSLFLPILVRVMPWLQAFVELLTEGVHWLAAFLGVEIQKVDFSGYESGAGAIEDVANSAGNATGALNDATKAAKEFKSATIGIDELNVISPPSASSSAGGAGAGGAGDNGFAGLDVGSLWDETIFDTIQSDVDAIKEKLKGWLSVIAKVATALAGMRLISLLTDMEKLKKLKIVKFFTDFGKSIKKIITFVKDYIAAAKQMTPVVGRFAAWFPKLSTALSSIGGALSSIGGFLAGISAPVWGGIAAAVVAVGSAIYFLVKNWEEVKKAVSDFFAENIAPKFEEIGKSFDKIKQALGHVYDSLIAPLIDGVKSLAAEIPWLGSIFEWLGGIVTGILGGVIGGAINAVVQLLQGAIEIITGIVQTLSGIVTGLINLVVGLFTGDFSKALDSAKLIWDGIVNVFKGAYDVTIGVVVEFVEGIIDWFTKMWDILVGHSIVPDTVNAIIKWFTSLPSKIFGSIEKFATGIVDKFKGMWSKLVSWWNGKTKLKEYTPSIGSIYDKIKDRWNNARDWWNNKKSAMKSYTPSIGSIYEKLSDRWKNAKDWWNKKKGSMSFTPSIGSITDKIKSAWNSAKSWWNKNAKLSTKLNISVPKITVKWSTASAFGKEFKYPTGFSLKFAANGGIFDAGSLIWAGERGAEIVANAGGGKTGVMNVQQMQDAVYEGVYAAMSAAMRGNDGGGSQVIRVYLDGKEITSTVEKTQRERGASIMGNEVYSF